MTTRQTATLVEALEIQDLRVKLTGTVRKQGVHVGGGRHVNMPNAWDGNGRVPPGWSGFHGAYEEEEQVQEMVDDGNGGQVKQISYRKLGTFAVELPDDTPERLLGNRKDMLTAAERTKLGDAFDAAILADEAKAEK